MGVGRVRPIGEELAGLADMVASQVGQGIGGEAQDHLLGRGGLGGLSFSGRGERGGGCAEQAFHDPGDQFSRWAGGGQSRRLGLGGLRSGRAAAYSGRDSPLGPANFAVVTAFA